MTTPHEDEDQIVISTDDARGALSPEETSTGDTMLPTLIIGTLLAIIAIALVWWLI